jgi:hypothetical protein
MSYTMSHQASIAGHAIVRLKNGTVYVGEATYDGRTITIDGRLRVIEMVDGASVFTYRPPRRRTIPLHIVREITWDDHVRRVGEHAENIPSPNGEHDVHAHRTAGSQQGG